MGRTKPRTCPPRAEPGRETLIPSRRRRGMARWREKLFAAMSRNSQRATAFFRIPPNRVVELGAQIEL